MTRKVGAVESARTKGGKSEERAGKKKRAPQRVEGEGGREEDERAAKGNGGKQADRGAEREEGTEDNKCQNNDPAVVRRTTRRIVGSRGDKIHISRHPRPSKFVFPLNREFNRYAASYE